MALWTSGGRSLEALGSAGWFSFAVPGGVSGVAVGFNRNDLSADPSEIERGMFFGAGSFRVFEGGTNRTASVPYTDGEVFYVVRAHDGKVYYCRTGTPAVVPGLSFALPGALVYTSTAAYVGDAYLDASLLSAGDSVNDAALTVLDSAFPDGTIDINFQPWEVAAAEGEYNSIEVDFQPMTLEAEMIEATGANINFLPWVVAASEGEYNSIEVNFEPPTASAIEGTEAIADGIDINFEPLTAYLVMGGLDTSEIDINFEPMHARGAEGDLAEINIFMSAPFAFAYMPEPATPYFAVSLPAFGNWELIPDIEDVVEVSEEMFTDAYRIVEDIFEVTQETFATSITERTITDEFTAEDATFQGSGWTIEDIFEIEDEAVYLGNSLIVEDEFVVETWVETAGVSEAFVEDVFEASDSTVANHVWILEDEFEALEETQIAAYVFVEDVFEALEEVSGTGHTAQIIEDIVEVLEEVFFTSIGTQLVVDEVLASDEVFKYDAGLIAWVMNTESAGVSWYDNWAFTDMAVGRDGKVFAIGPEGLSVIGGGTDAGTKIPARVEFGFTDFSGYDREGHPKNDSHQKKRVDSYWLGYTADGALSSTVETYGQGYPAYTYKMEPRAANSPRNNRIIPGKALNARYWRMTLANTNGCAFEVHSLAADIALSARRI